MSSLSRVFISCLIVSVFLLPFLNHNDIQVPLYSTPIGDVADPTILLMSYVSNNRIVNNLRHIYEDFWVAPKAILSQRFEELFGEDLHFGWTDVECYTMVMKTNNWPFRSVTCHWINTPKDVVLPAAYVLIMTLLTLWDFGYMGNRPFMDNNLGSWYISILLKMCNQPRLDCSNVRSTFVNTVNVSNRRLPKNHSHPRSALTRTLASQQCELICHSLGTHPYYLQQSKSDQRKNRDGCRTFFWGKDLASEYREFNPPANSTYCLIDVDYYLDMPYLLGAYPGHYLISSVQPTSAAHSAGEYQFTFNKDNEIHYTVSGGADYKHKIWNYKSDVITAVCPVFYGLYYWITSYNVDRRQLDDHHQLICLTPIYTLCSPFTPLTNYLNASVLTRLNVVVGDFARLDVVTKDGLKRSTARLGTYAVSVIPAEVDDALAAVSRMTNVKLTMAEVKTTAKISTAAEAAPLAEFHRSGVVGNNDLVYPVAHSVNRYQYTPSSFDPTAKNALIPFMSPLIPGCYSPDKCINNEAAGVKARVTDIATPELELTPKMKLYMEEFVNFVIPESDRHQHDPVDLSEVYERQNRPAQRALLHKAEKQIGEPSKQPISTFPKAEAYAEPKPERLISTIPPVDKLHYSSFIYSFSQALRRTKWYAFAKTPLEIAARVAMICLLAIAFIVKTDFSKMDGRVSNLFRALERLMMLAWFKPIYHARLIELMETQQNKRAFTTFGVEYQTKFARLSGSPETADFNSMDNAFTAYAGYRDQGMEPQEAYEALGLFGGDDGITADLMEDKFIASAKSLGQELEIDTVKRGESGVQMLSREYGPEVWEGDPNSMCDIKRQLAKFHTTTSLPAKISKLHKLAIKAFSYSLTDGNTPVIGEIGQFIIKRCPELIVQNKENDYIRKQVGSYFSHMPKDVQFPNERKDWMFDVLRRDIPTFDYGKFTQWLVVCDSDVEKLLSPPMFADILSYKTVAQKLDVVVNGDIVEAAKPPKQPAPGDAGPVKTRSKTPCRHFNLVPPRCSWGDKCKFAH